MKRSNLAAVIAAALMASPDRSHHREAMSLLPPKPRRPSQMRRASVRPWNARENERRRKQMASGALTSASRGLP